MSTSRTIWKRCRVLACLLVVLSGGIVACDTFTQEPLGVEQLYRWPSGVDLPTSGFGNSGGKIVNHFDLTALHGERELTRNAQFADVDNDEEYEILTRTMNENQVRALDASTGETIWVSPRVLPAADHPQISQLAVGDLDDDQVPEAVIGSYDGHVLCIDGRDGSLQWRRSLDYKINNPRLKLHQITDDPGLEIALTVSNRVTWNYLGGSGRINNVRDPSVLVLQSDGTRAWIATRYDKKNSGGHNTWAYDINEDDFSEVFAVGEDKLVVIDTNGTKLFNLPVQAGEHPDEVVVGRWTQPTPQIIYTDGIKEIAVGTKTEEVVERHRIPNRLNSHLQDLVLFRTASGPRLLAHNIRAKDAKMIMYNENFESLWAAQLGYDAAMLHTVLLDWNGDGENEIAVGSLEAGDQQCSLQVMETDGTPIYWHFLRDQPLCIPSDAADIDGDGVDELLMVAGKNLGGDGRYSLPKGASAHLFIFSGTP